MASVVVVTDCVDVSLPTRRENGEEDTIFQTPYVPLFTAVVGMQQILTANILFNKVYTKQKALYVMHAVQKHGVSHISHRINSMAFSCGTRAQR